MTARYHPRLSISVICLVALSGCVAPAEYIRPDLPAGIGWQADAANAGKELRGGEAWWTAFADPDLDRLVPVVLAANNDVFAASLRARGALLQAGLAAEAAMPKVSGSFNAGRTLPLSGQQAPSSQFGSGFALSYELDLWGRLAAQRDAALLAARASNEDIMAARLTVLAATVSTWWQLARTNQRIESAEKGLAVSRRTENIVSTMRAAQTVSELETLEARQAIDGQLASLEALKRDRDAQRVALAVLLNGAANPSPEPRRLPQGALPKLEAGLPASLVGRRPDLRAAELRLRATLRGIDERKANFYPQLPLTGALGTGGQELVKLFASPVATLSTNIALPFLNWRELGLQLRVSEAQYDVEVAAFRGTLLTALSEVANTLSARESLARETAHLARSLEAQRRIEGLYETRLKAGSIALRDLLQAQERTRGVENTVIDNRLARLLNEATLYRALGGSPPQDHAGDTPSN